MSAIFPVTAKRLPISRNAAIVVAVLALHIGFLWALQTGLFIRAVELVVPAEILAQIVEPSVPKVAEPPSVKRPEQPPQQPRKQAVKTPVAAAPRLLAVTEAAPSPNVPSAEIIQQPAAPPSPAPASAPPAPAPAAVQLPSSDADYLQNPKPNYPALSRRLGEQGKVTVRVLIGADGQPKKVELKQSSGSDRLDQSALATVMKWRYVPGKRGGVAEDMWFNVPLNFVLE